MRTYLIVVCVFCFLLVACKNETRAGSESVDNQTSQESSSEFNPHNGPVKPDCSAPPPVKDIWKLEPILIEKGLITEDMNEEQKEVAIRNYINKKNSVYQDCLKGK